MRWLKQQKLIFLTVVEAGSTRQKCQAGLVSGEASLLSLQMSPSSYVLAWLFFFLMHTCLERNLWHLCQIRASPSLLYLFTKLIYILYIYRVVLFAVSFCLASIFPQKFTLIVFASLFIAFVKGWTFGVVCHFTDTLLSLIFKLLFLLLNFIVLFIF